MIRKILSMRFPSEAFKEIAYKYKKGDPKPRKFWKENFLCPENLGKSKKFSGEPLRFF